MIDIRDTPLLTDIIQVVAQMDDMQREQWRAFNDGEFAVDDVAAALHLGPGPKWVLLDGERPLVVGGFTPVRKGVYHDWMAYAPEAFILHWRAVSKQARTMVRYMMQHAHRLECTCLAARVPEILDWYAFVGYSFEGTLRRAGVNGEDLAIFSRVRAPDGSQ